MKRMLTIAALPLCFAVVSGAQVEVQRDGTSHYVARNQAASALGWESKLVGGGEMLEAVLERLVHAPVFGCDKPPYS